MDKLILKKEKEIFLKQNIDGFDINEIVVDGNGQEYKVINKTKNSIELFIKKINKKGINSTQWFDMSLFNRYFKKKS